MEYGFMGYELRRWLADRLPAGLSSGERLVALEIADQANDATRLAYGRDLLDIVARRAGYANTKQVRKVLTKLAANGIELRVPLVGEGGRPIVGKDGRLVFACEGRETTYRVPAMAECPLLEDPPAGVLWSGRPLRGDPAGCPLSDADPRPEDERAPAWRPEGPRLETRGPPLGGPFSSSLLTSPQKPSPVPAVGGLTVRTARAAAKAPSAQPVISFAARAVVAAIPRYRAAPGWVRRNLAALAEAALAAGYGHDAITRYAALLAAEGRYPDHQHIPEFRGALARLAGDTRLGTTCPACGADPGDCPCRSPDLPGDRPWTDQDQADLQAARLFLGATPDHLDPTGTET